MAYPKIQCTYNTTLHIKPVPFLFRNIVLAELSSFITPVFFPVTNGPLLSRQVANTTVMYPLQLKLGCLRHTRTPCTPAWSAASQTGRQCVCVCINCNNRDPFSSIQGSGENIVPSLWPIMAIRRSNIRTVFDKAWPLLQDTINGHLSCLGKIDPFPLGCCLCMHEQRQTQSASISRAICLWRALQLDNTEFLDDGNYSLKTLNWTFLSGMTLALVWLWRLQFWHLWTAITDQRKHTLLYQTANRPPQSSDSAAPTRQILHRAANGGRLLLQPAARAVKL